MRPSLFARAVLWVQITLLLLGLSSVSCEFLNAAQVAADWELNLPTGSSLGIGNTVFATPNNNDQLLVTTNDGNLHIVTPSTKETLTFVPDPVPGLDTPFCESGVIYRDTYAIYSVINRDSASRFPSSSRLIAVHLEDATERWTIRLDGEIAGTPVLSNTYLYVTHNTVATGGVLTVIKLTADGTNFEVAATLPEQSTFTPFGPPTVKSIDDRDGGDVVYFCQSSDNGFGVRGALYTVQWSRDHDRQNGLGRTSYTFAVGSTSLGSCKAAPTVNNDMEVYVGTRSSILVGWDNGQEENLLNGGNNRNAVPWVYELQRNQALPNSPIPSSPVLSDDEAFLYIASAGREIVSLETAEERVAWSISLRSPALARPVYHAPGQETPVLYFMESRGGSLVQIDAETGAQNWIRNCRQQQCPNVEADYSISASNNMVYYGDVTGKLVGMRMAAFATPEPLPVQTSAPLATTTPTVAPLVSTSGPTITVVDETSAPIAGNSSVGNNSDENEVKDSESDSSSGSSISTTLLALVGGASGGLLLLIAAVICIVHCRRKKKSAVKSAAFEEARAGDLENGGEDGGDATPAKKKDRDSGSFGSNLSGTPRTLRSPEPSTDQDDAASIAEPGVEESVDQSTISAEEIARDLEEAYSIPSASASVTSGGSGRSRKSRKSSRSIGDAWSVSSGGSGGSQKRALGLFPRRAKSPVASPIPKSPVASPIPNREQAVERRAVSPIPNRQKTALTPPMSPTPSHEPGQIRPNQYPSSPIQSVMSVDSLYLDESTVASNDLTSFDKPKGDDAIHGDGSFKDLPNDCPEDEFSEKLRPGSHYLHRHNTKKAHEPKLPTIPSEEPKSRETRPMFKGVSVRPSRSRAGIFSRRQQPISTLPASEEVSAEEIRPEVPILKKKKNRKKRVIRTETPPPPSDNPKEVASPPHFTTHGYYVEEPDETLFYSSQDEEEIRATKQQQVDEGREEKKDDMWGSFMKELSKVESSFFSPSNEPPAETDDDESSAPPAPRTFYA